MKKMIVTGIAFMMMSTASFVGQTVDAKENGLHKETEQAIELNEEQKQEMAVLYEELFSTKEEIIKKYAEFGVISTEKAEEIVKKMQEHHKKVKESDFIPKWEHHKARKQP
ncbi:DUF2680 domain-containing protein [Alkalihalobacterium bogoriense]|uniref:DUF2680 domain-containing protein n=1 Tax=Alkalihalobacterium bogoriense TaxID=246272 RepID=UPI000683E278|nr:DUF2680 domain-containing protein [Alkalihalobacterium bogoriense]